MDLKCRRYCIVKKDSKNKEILEYLDPDFSNYETWIVCQWVQEFSPDMREVFGNNSFMSSSLSLKNFVYESLRNMLDTLYAEYKKHPAEYFLIDIFMDTLEKFLGKVNWYEVAYKMKPKKLMKFVEE